MNQEREEWRARFRAVSRAQSRYLYLLMLASVFFWALRIGNVPFADARRYGVDVPVLGVSLDPRVILDFGPIVLGLLMLALLGTFAAVTYAKDQLAVKTDDDFQRLDEFPNAIDFIVFAPGGTSRLARWPLLSYPVVIVIAYVEAWWLFLEGTFLSPSYTGKLVVAVMSGAVLIAAIPRLASFTAAKARRMIHK